MEERLLYYIYPIESIPTIDTPHQTAEHNLVGERSSRKGLHIFLDIWKQRFGPDRHDEWARYTVNHPDKLGIIVGF